MFEPFEGMTHQYTRTSYEQLKDFIYHFQEKLFDEGDAIRASIDSKEKLDEYNKMIRKNFVESIGGLIDTTGVPLNPTIRTIRDYEHFTVETLAFQSRPGVYVPSTLYVPHNIKKPSAAVLFVCGHGNNARREPDYQTVCQLIALSGLIVFAVDPLGQGERADYYDPETKTFKMHVCTPDHDSVGIPALSLGMSLERDFLCDYMRAVDYMQTRPEIDPDRIGITGNSGGGTQTCAMMLMDDRLKAACPGTFVTTRREYMYAGQCQDAEQVWPNMTAYHMDHVSVFMHFAPKPACILATKYDFFPIEGARETYENAKRIYGLFGKAENMNIFEDEYIHMYTVPLAIHAAEFFSEHLLGKKVTPRLEDVHVLTPEEMQYSIHGQMSEEPYPVVMPMDEFSQEAARLRVEREKMPKAERDAKIKAYLEEKIYGKNSDLRMPFSFNPRIFPKSACLQIGGYMGTTVSWWAQKRLFNYGVMIKPLVEPDKEAKPTTVCLWSDGSKAISKHEDYILAEIQKGRQVFVLDLSGMGAIEQRNMVINCPYREQYGTLYKLDCDLVYSGDSSAAFHSYEVLRALEMLKEEFGVTDIHMFVDGHEGVYGMIAAYLDRSFSIEYGKNLLLSVEDTMLSARPYVYDNAYGLILPGMLKLFDYKDLMR